VKVLVGCEFSGRVRDAFRALGHDAMSADFLPTEAPGPHYQGDVFDVIDYPWDVGIFHFPCTNTAVSGAKHFEAKWSDGRQAAGVSLFMHGWHRASHIPKVVFEHPVSIISTLFREPDQIVQPWWFGVPEFKAICLWTRGVRKLYPTNRLTPPERGTAEYKQWSKVHREPPGKERWKNRARTYGPLADALAAQISAAPQMEIAA
jgi:hypothetical protein